MRAVRRSSAAAQRARSLPPPHRRQTHHASRPQLVVDSFLRPREPSVLPCQLRIPLQGESFSRPLDGAPGRREEVDAFVLQLLRRRLGHSPDHRRVNHGICVGSQLCQFALPAGEIVGCARPRDRSPWQVAEFSIPQRIRHTHPDRILSLCFRSPTRSSTSSASVKIVTPPATPLRNTLPITSSTAVSSARSAPACSPPQRAHRCPPVEHTVAAAAWPARAEPSRK